MEGGSNGASSDEDRAGVPSGLSQQAVSGKAAHPLRFLSLFSGVGAFDLGMERAGHRTVAFCETDPFCRSILQRHWPDVRIYGDVSELTATQLKEDGVQVDAIIGGFPCQDISIAGRGAGIGGKRSRLWRDMERLVGEISPRLVIIENSPKLRTRGLDTILGGLLALGYDAEWHCIPATYAGAPHRRDRIWILAYPQGHAQRPYADSIRSYHSPVYVNREAELFHEQVSNLGPLAWRGAASGLQRVVDGTPSRLDKSRLKAIGNVGAPPELVEMLGRAIA